MSQFRHRFRVTVDGVSHDVVTSAHDYANAEVDADDTANGMRLTFALVHATLLRLDVAGVPADHAAFLDLLDDVTDLDGVPVGVPAAEVAELPDPTQSAA